MTGILKVDTIQKNNGGTPTVKDLGLNATGMVLQTVGGSNQATAGGSITTTSSSLVNTGISLSITPQYSTSKIKVTLSIPAQVVGNGSTSTYGAIALYRNGSNVLTGTAPAVMSIFQNPAANANTANTMGFTWIDSPASTSAVTYALYYLTTAGSFNLLPQVQNMSTSTGYTYMLEEIAG